MPSAPYRQLIDFIEYPPSSLARFAETGFRMFVDASAPIQRVHALPHRPVKGGIRPVPHLRHQPMANRVEMQVIHVTLKIVVVADQVFPEASLPEG